VTRTPAKTAAATFAAALLLLLPIGPGARAQADDPPLKLTLGYDGRLLVKVLDIEIEQQATRSGFSTSARLISTGILRLFKHIDERAVTQGRLSGSAVRPWIFDYQRLASKTHRRVKVTWTGSDVQMTTNVPFPNMGDPPATLEQKLAAADPLTQLMRITLDGGRPDVCSRSYLFFDGRQLYALDFSNRRAADESATENRLGLTHHFRCDVRFREVAGYGRRSPDKRDQGLKKPVAVDIAEVGDKGVWVISKMQAPTPLGYAVIELKRLTVNGEDPTT
jgi:hypothetical protein